MKKLYQSPDVLIVKTEVINLICLSVKGNAGLNNGGQDDDEARGRTYNVWDDEY